MNKIGNMNTPAGETIDRITLDRAVVNIKRLRVELDRGSPHQLERTLERLGYTLHALTILHRQLKHELEISRHPDAER